MDIEKIFHMKGGIGNNSYANNSHLQRKASDMVKHITMEAIEKVYLSTGAPTSFGIADLGCSSGPNTLSIIKEIIQAVQSLSSDHLRQSPEFRVYLNDLPTNDFNSIFKALPDFCRELQNEGENQNPSGFFIGAYPGSFYKRLFPSNSLHFVHSSYSLHWLSRVPEGVRDEFGKPVNRGTIYISERSPKSIVEAYVNQFRRDFWEFLRKRGEEVVSGGRMVLILLGRDGADHVDRGNSFMWHLLARAFAILVSQGEVKEEKLDSYDVNFYAANKEEIEEEVRREGSFGLERIEKFELEKKVRMKNNGDESYGKEVAKSVRAIQESMISHHFGDSILDSLFLNYGNILDEEMAKQEIRPISFVIVLTKL
ncbi:hypothetical protein IC582_017031 [Cucumis melo]|uniref:Salicylate carboxymethyltransferase n=1 Tax=Cucumis melo TaxID=3656 RepID=A0A1S3BSG5_CUCME|nr:probable methyltransferase TCM_000336 [Cucumis melo]